jgi:hypothetical protein
MARNVGEVTFRGSHGVYRVSPVKAIEGVQRVAHRALVRVQTRNDDEA